MSGAATSQYGVASTTAMAGQTPPTGAGGAASATDYTAFGVYGNYFNLLMNYFNKQRSTSIRRLNKTNDLMLL